MSDSDSASTSPGVDEQIDLPGYRILEKLGEGGMGCVYRAEDRESGKVVAIKVLYRKYSGDQNDSRRFLRGAKLSSQLSHEGIVKTLDAGEHESRYYIVMEMVEGPTLSRVLEEHGPLDESDTIDLALDVARALKHAYAHHIIHRDIKPSNIILAEDGQAKILDFGMLKPTDEVGEALTRTGCWMGTPYFMSPEQAIGDGKVDIRSDLYSLGATLYRTVVGEVPFDGNTQMSVLNKHLNKEPTPPNEKRPSISEGFGSLLMKLLEKDPDDRFTTPRELVDALERLQQRTDQTSSSDALQNKQAHSPSGSEPKRKHSFFRSGRTVVLLVILMITAIFAGAVYTTNFFRNEESEHVQSTSNAQKLDKSEAEKGEQAQQEEKDNKTKEESGPVHTFLHGRIEDGEDSQETTVRYDFSHNKQIQDWKISGNSSLSYDGGSERLVLGEGGAIRFSTYMKGDMRFTVGTRMKQAGLVGISLSDQNARKGYICYFSPNGENGAVLKKWSTNKMEEVEHQVLDRDPQYNLSNTSEILLSMEISGSRISVSAGETRIVSAKDEEFRRLVPGLITRGSNIHIDHLSVQGTPDRNWLVQQLEETGPFR